MREHVIVISTRTLLAGLALVVGALLVVALRDVLVIVLVALVLSAAMDPSIARLEKRGVPRPAGLAIIFFGSAVVIALIGIALVPLIVEQTQQFVAHLPEIYQRNLDGLRRSGYGHVARTIENGMRSMSEGAGVAAERFFGGAMTVVRGTVSFLGAMVLTFYMAMQQQAIKSWTLELTPLQHRDRAARLLRRMKVLLGQWLRGQLLLGALIGLVTYVGLMVLDVNFALVLALIAAITELVPVIGPIIGAIPAIIVAAADEPVRGLWVALLFTAIQQLENHVLVPRVMATATGLNPVTVLVAILVGARLAGVLGVFLAVPASIILQVLVEDLLAERRLRAAAPAPDPSETS